MPLDATPFQGKNFAPSEPLVNAKRTRKEGSSSSLSAFFREIYEEVEQRHVEARRQQMEMARVISTLRAGKLTIKGDAANGYVFARPFKTAERSNYPLFPQNSETLKAKWAKARPTFIARSNGNGYKAEIQQSDINRAIKHYFKDIFTPDKELQESIEAQDYGTYIWQFYYDENLNQMSQIVPVIQNQSKVLLEIFKPSPTNTPLPIFFTILSANSLPTTLPSSDSWAVLSSVSGTPLMCIST